MQQEPNIPLSDNFELILDNSKDTSIINRESGLYQIYNNIYISEPANFSLLGSGLRGGCGNAARASDNLSLNFIDNLANVLEDLYDNNESVVFHLYFLTIPKVNYQLDFKKLMLHLNKYPLEYILDDNNITKFYKNIGLIYATGIIVFLSLCDIDNLRGIAKDINIGINTKIKIINSNVHKDLNNTIVNFKIKFEYDSEIMLIIYADYSNLRTPGPSNITFSKATYYSHPLGGGWEW